MAAISIVAYNGIQTRAHLSKVTSSVDASVKLLEMYRIDHGSYPDSNSSYYCIGAADTYPGKTPFEAGACNYWDGAPSSSIARVNTDFNNLLKQYSNTSIDGSIPPATQQSGSYTQRGVFYFYSSYSNTAYLTYGISGDYDCYRGVKRNWYLGMTTCEVTLKE